MAFVGTILDILAALVLAFGGIGLIYELYSSLVWRTAPARILAWTPKMNIDGKTVIGHTARVAYTAEGAAQESDCRGANEQDFVTAHPAGSDVTVRYPAGSGEMPEIKESLVARFWFPLACMATAVGLYAMSSLTR